MSRHKVIARRWKVFGVLCVLVAVTVTLAADFGILPKEVVEGYALTLVVPLVVLVGYFIAWGSTHHHAMRHCERCGRDIKIQERSQQRFSPRWWGQFAICEACVLEESFLLSLPNRRYSHGNQLWAARWKKIATLVLLLMIGAGVALLVLNAGVKHAVAALLFWSLFVVHGVVSARSAYYRKSFCVRCTHDLEKYEWRLRGFDKTGAVMCERCADEQGGDDAEDGEGGDDNDEERFSYS